MKHDGTLIWSSESPTRFNPQYLVGDDGVAMCLLRLRRGGFRHQTDTW